MFVDCWVGKNSLPENIFKFTAPSYYDIIENNSIIPKGTADNSLIFFKRKVWASVKYVSI